MTTRLCTTVLLSTILFAGCSMHTKGPKISAGLPQKPALLVIDIQKDFVGPNARMPVDKDQADVMIRNTNRLIDSFRSRGADVIYIVNEFSPSDRIANCFRNRAAIAGTQGAELSIRIRRPGAALFTKSRSDAFSNEEFDKYIRQENITSLVLTGVFADRCVLQTARGAIHRGYSVTTVSDAISTRCDQTLSRALAKHRKAGAYISSTSSLLGK